MTRILFVVPQLSHGGSNRSLSAILALLRGSDVEPYVATLDGGPETAPYFQAFLPYLVRLSRLYGQCIRRTVLRKGLNAMQNFLHLDPWGALYAREARRLERRYRFDRVVGFEESYATLFASHFAAPKLAWVHCDYTAYREASGGRDETSLYGRFERIVCVSRFAARVFTDCYPTLAPRVTWLYNFLDVAHLEQVSLAEPDDAAFRTDRFTLVSVGRFVALKQFHLIPALARRMREAAPTLAFRWYVIADGDPALVATTQAEVERYGLGGEVVLLGAKANPYPYIRRAHLLVCLSQTESWSYVINEALALQTPVATLRCGSTDEVLTDSVGCIASLDAMPTLLADLAQDKDQTYSRLKSGLKHSPYRNRSTRAELLHLLHSSSTPSQ